MNGRAVVMSGGFDPTRPNVARMNDYLLGGKDNFAADRAAAEKALEVAPELLVLMREWRKFIRRVVRFLAESGIRQFLDIGTGLPADENIHEIAQATAPDARVAYVDDDPVASAHAQALLEDNELTIGVRADISEPREIMGHPRVRKLIDVDQPVAILLLTVLHRIPDDDVAERIVAEFKEAIVPGSYVAIQHAVSDIRPDVTKSLASLYQDKEAITGSRRARNTRTKAQIESLFDGLDVVEPGVVYIPNWRPDAGDMRANPESVWLVGGVGRKR
ncbi:MAG: SAM-dependent methyltransferase [Micromonosporaceae bacterium]